MVCRVAEMGWKRCMHAARRYDACRKRLEGPKEPSIPVVRWVFVTKCTGCDRGLRKDLRSSSDRLVFSLPLSLLQHCLVTKSQSVQRRCRKSSTQLLLLQPKWSSWTQGSPWPSRRRQNPRPSRAMAASASLKQKTAWSRTVTKIQTRKWCVCFPTLCCRSSFAATARHGQTS